MMQQVDNWVPERLRRSGRSTGRWKTHTPESMCRTAFANLYFSFATKAVDWSCKSHALHCTWLAAGVVHSASHRATDDLKRPLASVSGTSSDVDDFHINNLMFDETQLWLNGARGTGKKRQRVPASASQVTRRAPGGCTVDVDVLRPPSIDVVLHCCHLRSCFWEAGEQRGAAAAG